ncbi:MAG: hypothetical protein HRU13_08780 [Phycisphaerales bacterium]|nr:hypothetical protein [Phycisphaerales bacterium]
MDDHVRLHMDSLVHEACDLLCETAMHRCDGPTNALRVLRDDPNAEGVWLDRFVDMFLREHSLASTAGACAILEAFERRPMPSVDGGAVGESLRAASVAVFTDLVRLKAEESLERASVSEGASA